MIDSFDGANRFLSNFWPAPVEYEGLVFPSVEHAYQAAKHPAPFRSAFVKVTAGQAKRMGQTGPIRIDWDKVKVQIMLELLRKKFIRGSKLAQELLDTGDALLVEGNTWGDTFWGVYKGRGDNRLGKLLMQVRDELRQ